MGKNNQKSLCRSRDLLAAAFGEPRLRRGIQDYGSPIETFGDDKQVKLSHFDYELPKELIAQTALSDRTEARLLVLNREHRIFEHRTFREIIDYFEAGDVLVLNDTKVIPARIFAKRKSGGHVEILALGRHCEEARRADEAIPNSEIASPDRPSAVPTVRHRSTKRPTCARSSGGTGRPSSRPLLDQPAATIGSPHRNDVWEVLIKPSGRVRKGEELLLTAEHPVAVRVLDESHPESGIRRVEFQTEENVESILNRIGRIPLPPYIEREDTAVDRELYQTVFARHPGAVASPTAGLHFDQALLKKIEAKGVEILFVTLHVSYGTFQPVVSDDLAQHQMHEERFEISNETAQRINFAKAEGRRIVVCGTTVVRTLESQATITVPSKIEPGEGMTGLFIYPPYEFKIVDQMITNFHLPRTTLLMLTNAFTGHDFLMSAYREAITRRYRFYSYGDAMLIL